MTKRRSDSPATASGLGNVRLLAPELVPMSKQEEQTLLDLLARLLVESRPKRTRLAPPGELDV